ncbi:MAG: hypothetical protein Edafosvirus13_14 [Edafosvirus sp.]|uniref:Uncharacterized protein n=1 Tax=Edafosvirus sp. TaxID=2487765 RepID=A0A3G4ZYG8_9VIRU|nr:MAG: hypothetical protein Edafosvirus13_14 [Edafosvirus sp.]
MGNSVSNQQVVHNKQSSHDIQRRIRHIFLNDNKDIHFNETIGWRDSDVARDPVPDVYANLQGGTQGVTQTNAKVGKQSRRNRYDKFDLKNVLNAQKGAGTQVGLPANKDDDYHEMASELSELNKVKAYLEKDVRMGLNMAGGCGCSNGDLSATSSAFANTMQGGAQDDKKKSGKKRKSKRDELDEIEDVLNDENIEDEDEDEEDEDDDDEDDKDEDEDDDDDDDDDDNNVSRTPSSDANYPKRGKKTSKLSDYSYTSSQANRSEDININPFLSSDSDNVKHLQSKNRFN